MKYVLGILILVTFMASQGHAGFFDSAPADGAKQEQKSDWTWESIKQKVSTKISSLLSRWRGESPKVAEVSHAVNTPVTPADPVAEQPQSQEVKSVEKIVAKEVAPKKISQEKTKAASGDSEREAVEVTQPPQHQEAPKPVSKIKSWFDYVLSRVRGNQPSEPTIVTQASKNAQTVSDQSEPIPQRAEVQNSQAVAAGETPQAQPKSLFGRFTTWLSQLGKPAPLAEETSQQVPETARIQNVARGLASINPSRVATPAVPFKDENLIMGHNNIPVFRFSTLENKLKKEQVKRIPLLNVGQEEILDSNTFTVVNLTQYPLISFIAPKRLDAPEVASNSSFRKMLGDDVNLAKLAEKIEVPVLEAAKKVTGDKIAKIVYTLTPDVPYTALPVVAFNEEDLKLLRGLILFEKKDQCHIASGIFSDLIDATKPDVSESSHFHLGICLHEMNLPTEALHHLLKTMHSKNTQFAHDSIKAAVEDLQLQSEMSVVDSLLGADPQNIPKESLPEINYLKAKYYIKKNQASKALESALLVPEKTPQYYKAQYVASVAEYELGKTDSSLSRQKNMALELTKNGKDKDVLALFEMNLGRAAFQKGKYKDSLEAFQKVPKENSLWIQSLMEEAWVQLQSKDMAGAIGNMHSIQSPYFNGVYKPESYVLRAIAYLSICQYPDAYKSIAFLDHTYQPWLDKLNKYNSTHNSTQAYDTIIRHLQAKTNPDTDELPFQALREAARQRDFLNAQQSVNQLIDENSGYPFVRGLIEKDRKSLLARRNATILKAAQLREKVRKASSLPDGMKHYNEWRFELANLEDFLNVYEFKVKTLREGLDGLNKMIPKAQERIAENKEKIKGQAGKIIKEHLVKLAKELRQNLDNDELLKYEVYAGSGENLRFKIAGGKTGGSSNMSDRKPAGEHWDFDGEYWEDEIGNYRSSLKNNCQNLATGPGASAGAGKVKKGEAP